VLTNGRYGARLQALGAFGRLCDKTHLIADYELVERPARDAVAVEKTSPLLTVAMNP
jgi:hypothetical protein